MVARLLEMLGFGAARPDWAGLADGLDRTPHPVDPDLRDQALLLRRDVSRFLQASDPWARRRGGLEARDLPPGTDWQGRPRLLAGGIQPAALTAPASGQRLGADAALWHDCPHRALILRQMRQPGEGACHALRIEVMGFSGSFLSLSVDLPEDALTGLDDSRILQIDTVTDAEREVTICARLNLMQGPNTETMLRQLGDPVAGQGARRLAEFDLAYAGLAPRPVEKAWLDVILESPRMNAVTIRDAVVTRRPRAQA